jgi:hypothetical protein
VESGASRNFEPWHEEDVVGGIGHILHIFYVSISLSLNLITLMYFFSGCGQRYEKKREAEEMGDAMRSLEEQTTLSMTWTYLLL